MQIQLKQREIAEALKMFISQQGINLTGKSVEIEFTSGRKDNGLSAELTIEDIVQAPADTSTVRAAVPPTAEAVADPAEAPPVAKAPSLFK